MSLIVRRIAGAALHATALGLVVALYLVVQGAGLGLLVGLLLAPVWLLVGALFYWGQRLSARSLDETTRQDRRPPVLYLRPFDLDQVRFRRRGLWAQLLVTLPFPWETARVLPRLTLEEALVGAFETVGPVVALGHPARPLEPVGAARAYAGDDWQDQVDALAARAGVIVMVPDDRPSVVWELEHLERHLDKLVVVPQPAERGDAARRQESWDALREAVPYLPEIDDRTALVRFEEGQPRVVADPTATPQGAMRQIRRFVSRSLGGRPYDGWISVPRGAVSALWTLGVPLALLYAESDVLRRSEVGPGWFFVALVGMIAALSATRPLLPCARRLGLRATVHPARTPNPVRWATPRLLGVATVLVLVVSALGGEWLALESGTARYTTPSASMEPTLPQGSRFYVRRARGRPERGSIVVFQSPRSEWRPEDELRSVPTMGYVKRVVAVEGDTVSVRGDRVFVNEQALASLDDPERETAAGTNHPYAIRLQSDRSPSFPGSSPRGRGLDCDDERCTVLPGHVFVLGDNRHESEDSRHFGGVPTDNIVARVVLDDGAVAFDD